MALCCRLVVAEAAAFANKTADVFDGSRTTTGGTST